MYGAGDFSHIATARWVAISTGPRPPPTCQASPPKEGIFCRKGLVSEKYVFVGAQPLMDFGVFACSNCAELRTGKLVVIGSHLVVLPMGLFAGTAPAKAAYIPSTRVRASACTKSTCSSEPNP